MKYSMIVFAGAFLLGGMVQAGESGTVSEEEATDFRYECIRAAIADELEKEQMDGYVDQCVQDMLAGRKITKDKKG